MKKLLILALTSAFVAAANAAGDWFSVAVSGSSQETTGAKWSVTPAPAAANSVISIDEDVDTALALTPDALSPDAQTNTVVTVEATFTAISDVPENLTGATTALTVAKENNVDYYFYWDGDSWEKITTVSPTLNTPVTVRIELDNTSMAGTTATIKVDGTTVATVVKGTKTKVSGLAFAGTGKIGNINADYTKAYASYNNTYYATVGGAIAAKGGNSGDITVYAHNNEYPANIIKGANDVLLFPRTTTVNQDGSTVPYEIADADDLIALTNAVASVADARSKSYKQTANIDMASAGAFAGIGIYNATPTAGTPFTGTYDGGNYKISNVTMTGRNYGGIFNQVNGGTIKNLTVENISTAATSGEFGYAIVGNAGNGATLENLTAAGAFLSAEKPGTHNMAGIVVRACGGGVSGTLITNCTNNAIIYGNYTKLGGICALTQNKVSGGAVTFDGCVNNGTLVSARTAEENALSQITGIAGIVGYTADATVLKDCVNNGTITVALADQTVGELVGSGGVETYGSLTDAGGNKADATKKMVHTRGVVTGFQYATVANNVATTIAPPYTLTKDTTYLLEGNVGAGTVFTLAAAGDTIAFDTALDYTFAGTVGSSVLGWSAKSAPDGTVTTYSLEQTATPVVSTAETTLVAVPKACTAATLIDLSNRVEGDVLKAYNTTDGFYYTWTLSSGKAWTPATTYKLSETDSTSHSKPASDVHLSAGQAAWLTRTTAESQEATIILAVVAESDKIDVTVDNGWNMIAPLPKGNATTVALNEVVSAGAAGDEIKIPTAGAPITCTYDSKTEKWGYWQFTKNDKGRITGKVWVPNVTIPAGTGLWYINGGDSKSVELK